MPQSLSDSARDQKLAKLSVTFWSEQSDFVNRHGEFAQGFIWNINQDDMKPHVWHRNYSYPVTKVLGKLACIIVLSKPLGIGQCERNWKIYKKNKKGQRGRLADDKAKKQSVVAGA